MSETLEFALRTVLIGAGATMAMDALECSTSEARVMLRSRATATKVLS